MKNTLKVKRVPESETFYIEMDRTFAKNAEDTSSAEFKKLQEVRAVYPDAKIVTRRIKKNPNQEHHKGLTYDFMEDYIRNYAPEKTRKADLDEFHQKLIISECHSKAFRYPTIKKWFLDKYPEVTSFVLTAAANQQPPAVQAPAALDPAA